MQREIFFERAGRYFTQTITNALLLLVAVLCMVVVLYRSDADLVHACIWALIASFLIGLMVIFRGRQWQLMTVSRIKWLLAFRVINGFLISCLFGVTLFLVPEQLEALTSIVTFLYVINMTMIAGQVTFPDYYFAYSLGMFGSILLFLLSCGLGEDDVVFYTALLFFTVIALYSKYATLSLMSIGDVGLRKKLEHEKNNLKVLQEEIKARAYMDDLTGVFNRRYLKETIEKKIVSNRCGGFLVAFLDLNSFKEVNDVLGHSSGDRVLVEVAELLRTNAPEGCIVSRLGGDEFCLVCDETDPSEVVGAFIEQLKSGIRVIVGHEQNILEVTASIGVAIFPDDGDDFGSLLSVADRRMYRDKNG